MSLETPERIMAREVVQKLVDAGHEALWAGGCVRDEILGLSPSDYDIATSARPEQVRRLFRKTIAVGASFGVIEVIGPRKDDGKFVMTQVATFRADLGYSDGRRPDSVRYCDAREDALRRDFTINGMFYDPIAGKLVDYVGGRVDLENKVLRAIGDPSERFAEDRLRMLRAVRLTARFVLSMEPATAHAILAHANAIRVVSAERITEEMRKILGHPSRAKGLELFLETGLAREILPELYEVETAGWDELISVLNHLPPDAPFPLGWAALLRRLPLPKLHSLSVRLKLSNAEMDLAVALVKHQDALSFPEKLKLSELKKLLAQPWIDLLIQFMHAIRGARGESQSAVEYCLARLSQWSNEEINPLPLINGDDLKGMGYQPGPRFKDILESIRDDQLNGIITSRAEAMERAQKLAVP